VGDKIKIKQAKKVILILLATLLASFCIVTLIGAISFVQQNPAQNKIEAAADFDGSGTQADPYIIKNKADFDTFTTNINNGNSYSGTYFQLGADINFDSTSCKIEKKFNGVFDGNGFKFSNITQYQSTVDALSYGGTSNIIYALFPEVGSDCIIKNLKLLDCMHTTNVKGNTSSSIYSVAGFIGIADEGAKIESCEIENFTLKNIYEPIWNDWNTCTWGMSGIYDGGFDYNKNLTIKDCKVICLKTSRPNAGGKADQMKVNTHYLTQASDCPVSSCIVITTGGETDLGAPSSATAIYSSKTGDDFEKLSSINGVGGEDGPIWYYCKDLNDGWPMLRIFMNWSAVQLVIKDVTMGDFDKNILYIPYGENLKVNNQDCQFPILNFNITYPVIPASNALTIYGEVVTLSIREGWVLQNYTINAEYLTILGIKVFSYWKITANFELNKVSIEFGPPVDENGNVIPDVEIECTEEVVAADSSVASASYSIPYGTEISVNIVGNKLTYSWIADGKKYSIKYSIPEGYEVYEPKSGTKIIATNETSLIQPIYKKITYTVILIGNENTNNTSDTNWIVNYKDDINFDKTTLTFAYNGDSITYDAKEDYVLDYLKINNTEVSLDNVGNMLTEITQNIEIEPVFVKLITITLNRIQNATLLIDEYSIEPLESYTSEEVKAERSLKVEYSGYPDKIVKYKYNDELLAVYKLDQFYILKDAKEDASVENSVVITPEIEFYACTITMTKTNLDNVATMSVMEDDYETENDGIFVVEYGTTVTFKAKALEAGLFEYIYTFKYGNETVATITYKTENNQYAMSSEISGGNRKWHTQIGVDDETYDEIDKDTYGTEREISPEFEKKFYEGNLA